MKPEALTLDQRDMIPTDIQLELTGVAYVPKVLPPWESVKWIVTPDGTLRADYNLSREESYRHSGIAQGFRGIRRFVRAALNQ